MKAAAAREKINRDLALLSGWTKTKNGNWRSPWGEVFATPPDYCRGRRDLASEIMLLEDDQRELIAQLVLRMMQKGAKK